LGDIAQMLAAGKLDQAEVRAQAWARICSPAPITSKCSVRAAANGAAADEVLVAASADLAARLGLPLVATHPVQFISRDDYKAHEARVCIAEGYVLGDKRRPQRFSPEQYFKTRAEMAELFADLPEALAEFGGDRAPLQPQRRTGQEPPAGFPDPERRAAGGLPRPANRAPASKRRLEQLYPDAPSAKVGARSTPSASISRSTIVKMGFPGYFLIVADFINWAKHNGVPVGPGRGSGAGSLVAYASASPTSIRCATTCCSSASSIRNACRCPTSTSTSARKGATASSTT
jgi:DNA polymerase-3 subunit alpha